MPHTGTKKHPLAPQTLSTRRTMESQLGPHINSVPCCALHELILEQRPMLWLLIAGHDTVHRIRATSMLGPHLPSY